VPRLVRQAWRQVTFVHWQFPAEVLRPLVPSSLEVDTFAGSAWVGLTPFSTTCEVLGTVPCGLPKRFAETNVRTYVSGPDGNAGLWFLSLDVANRVNAWFGRLVGLPYHHGDFVVERGSELRYAGRRDAADARYAVTVRPGAAAAPSDLADFLTARWSAYAVRRRRLLRFDVEHEPWPLQRADLVECAETMLAAAGLPPPAAEPLVHTSPGVNAHLAGPRLVGR
jgi:uncharacterized protein YqjF (DUF2071 family)